MSNSDATTLWTDACAHLEKVLGQDVYSRWIAVIEADAVTDHTLTLLVDNDFYQTWLEENYLPLIHEAVSAVSGTRF